LPNLRIKISAVIFNHAKGGFLTPDRGEIWGGKSDKN